MWKLLLAALPLQALAQVTGSASGFAAGVTGGGNATPAAPKDIAELTTWLTDDTPRVIMLDKEYNFLEAEGTATETGCRPASNTCGSSGQDALDGPNWCSDSYPAVEVTYDVAPTKPIDIKGNKSIVGVGSNGVIRGKGFRLVNGVSNIIIQNVHFTELNPEYIWGGDALQLSGTDMVWIDHCKFSLIGRQMIVTGYSTAGRVTISNNEFDGKTSWSASCNGEHYWTMLLIGEGDQITLANNYIHDVSGRAPKIGNENGFTLHAVNNYFADSLGHNFDIGDADVLIEGNVFDNCKTPILGVTGNVFNAPASALSSCTSALGRACVANSLTGSGSFPDYSVTSVLNAFTSADNITVAIAVNQVAASVKANAGIGQLSGSSSESISGSSSSSSKAAFATSTKVAAVATTNTAVTLPTSSKEANTGETATTTAKASSATATTTKAAETGGGSGGGSGSVSVYNQCGGTGYSGATACDSGLVCKQWNDWYYQCIAA